VTALELCKEIGLVVAGRTLTDDEAGGIIWEHTGFPAFWACKGDEKPEDCFRRQLREFFEQEKAR
jgi:hypothetical protein